MKNVAVKSIYFYSIQTNILTQSKGHKFSVFKFIDRHLAGVCAQEGGQDVEKEVSVGGGTLG